METLDLTKSNKVFYAKLRTRFETTYPEYAKLLNNAKNEGELKRAYEQIKTDAFAKAKPYLTDAESEQGFPALALTPTQYQSIISASGSDIEVQVTSILHELQIINPSWSPDQVTAQFIMGGLTAITAAGVGAFVTAIDSSVAMAAAVLAGVELISVAGVVAVIAATVVAIIIPILYFMLKPASCIILVLNETSSSINWVDDYNVHGKPVIRTDSISQAVTVQSNSYVGCGIVQTDKRDDALVGTQYGFTYTNGVTSVSFGVECPLTGIWVNNNCYCGINSSSENLANQTDSQDVLSYSTQADGLSVSIACNSGSGSCAYYVARIIDGSIS